MGAPAAVVTSEQSAEEYVGGMIAAEAGVPVSRLNVPGVSAHSLAMVKSAEKTVSGWNLDIEDAPMTRPQLISHFGRKISKGAKFALYDFAQDIMPSSNIEEASDEKRVSGLSVSFRWMLKKAGIPGILISSENYQSGMKYSRQIESDAWVWLQIQKADGYDPENYPAYKVTVKKARFAPNGLDQLLFWRNGRLLVETEWQASKARFTASSSNQAGSPTVRQAWAARNKEEEDAAEKARKSIAAITQPEFPAVEDSNDDDPFR
jgi:replicative DNA helicase